MSWVEFFAAEEEEDKWIVGWMDWWNVTRNLNVLPASRRQIHPPIHLSIHPAFRAVSR
jgi:hypothetical protein